MIYGVGTDLVSLKRIARLNKKPGMSFAERILSPEELLEFPQVDKPISHLARQFAAKEALARAVGMSTRDAVTFHNVGVDHGALSKPEFFYAAPLAQWLRERGIMRVHLSMSNEEDTISTFTVTEWETV